MAMKDNIWRVLILSGECRGDSFDELTRWEACCRGDELRAEGVKFYAFQVESETDANIDMFEAQPTLEDDGYTVRVYIGEGNRYRFGSVVGALAFMKLWWEQQESIL
jgi:hypothetical protein